ncbi:MAG: beta-mannosidase [Bacteroidales bacterium]
MKKNAAAIRLITAFPRLHILLLPAVIYLVSCASSLTNQGVDQFELKTGWEFKNMADTGWLTATVPGTVHTDLAENGLTGDSFYRDNEAKQQWIENETWCYRNIFDVPPSLFDKENIQLTFEGLDTYAAVILNSDTILSADNMFRTWTTDVRDLLKDSGNLLEIVFTPATIRDSIRASEMPYQLPDRRGFSRKAPYQYGWDWGPRFATCGIWRPVTIAGWNGIRMENIRINQRKLQSDVAVLDFIVEWSDEIKTEEISQLKLEIYFDEALIEEYASPTKPGTKTTMIPISVSNPKLWWCNGMGAPDLYNYRLELIKDKKAIQSLTGRFGIREIELVRENDSIGQSFYFKINGKPVFIKGANYIPQDNFLPRVTDPQYHQLIQNAAAANMNMLRVWGGGIYEKDLFYDLCDEYGIMVWQDFMFACNMYPGDSAFMINVKAEARDNIVRLRNHPCLALWCGNNEVDEGWHNWGWQKSLNYSDADSAKVWNDYVELFHQLLPETIEKYDPGRPYHPSSPTIGWGHEESRRTGDSHYWGVWWGEEPFEIYKERVPRFMSEYGFQGMPPLKTIESFTLPEDRVIGSEIMESHQKHPRGTELIHTYMERDYQSPSTFEDYIYVSQLVQAEGIRTAIEAHRRAMPYCMGTLYWQLNDCWPVTSWSSVDYYGRWKALHYFVKEAFAETMISPVFENDSISVFIVSDSYNDITGSLRLQLMDFEGKLLWQTNHAIQLDGPGSGKVIAASAGKILRDSDRRTVMLIADFMKNGQIIASNFLYFEKPKDLRLSHASPDIQIKKTVKGYEIEINSQNLIKNLALRQSSIIGHFDKNFIDIIPGRSTVFNFITTEKHPDLGEGLRIECLNNVRD